MSVINIQISKSAYPEIYNKILGYKNNLESQEYHNKMVEEVMNRVCIRLNDYNNKLKKCCDGNASVASLARFVVTRREMIKCFSTYSEFCEFNFDIIPLRLLDIVFKSYLWVRNYKTHPRLRDIETAPSNPIFENYL